ncbi:MAG: ATP-dependent DNA helicase [Candidatus ainarchaeum sp.]|nr:ATP-dependent DNA helicase [Candidatus ainarchaeum sp.]
MPYFRHDHVRPHQKALMDDIYSAICDGRNFMAQAPTGSGKSDAALSAAVTSALERKQTVFFLTPKISQHRIALDVVRGIAERHSLQLRAVDMVGRFHCCIDRSLSQLDNESFQNACARRRKKQECQFYGNARGYGRLGELKAELVFRKAMGGYGAAKSHDELIALGMQHGCCPYEWLLKLGESSNVIIADYYHLMVPKIRDVFLAKVKKRLEDSIVIIDEAHNLASRVRESMSSSVNGFTFMRVRKEMRSLGMDAGPVDEVFALWAERILARDEERLVSPYSLHDFIAGFGLTVDEIVPKLAEAGFDIVEKTGKKSACLNLAGFLTAWGEGEEESVRVLKRKNGNFYLSKRLLDPSPATKALNACASSVLMSGTLLPLQMHRDVLGLDPQRTTMKSYPSPFNTESIVNIVTPDVTTKYSRRDDEGYAAIAGKLDSVIEATPGGTAIFFPSYVVMDAVLPLMRPRSMLVQKSGMKPHEVRQMLKEFRHGGQVLCGVQGGSLAEGVDYCAGEIKTVVIVGVALDEMDVEKRALIDYYDGKFGRGWDYGYLYPGTIKALQAAGRARRKDGDRVAVVYMDERFQWGKYSWILNKDEKTVVSERPEDEVGDFWKEAVKARV